MINSRSSRRARMSLSFFSCCWYLAGEKLSKTNSPDDFPHSHGAEQVNNAQCSSSDAIKEELIF